MTYYATTALTPDQRARYRGAAADQELLVLGAFGGDGALTPSQCHVLLLSEHHPMPITSVRRAITSLTARGRLRKTDRTAIGPYGWPEHIWETIKPRIEL